MASEGWLIWSMLFGAIGFGYLVYARKQRAVVPLVCGVLLLVLPYLITNLWLLVGISFCVIFAPKFV